MSERLAFGTGGLRGAMGQGDARMNERTVRMASAGVAEYILASGYARSVAIGCDTRNNSASFARASAEAFARAGVAAFLYDRALPTPLVSYAVRALGCGAGVMITASHNPREDNGYKVYAPDGGQVTLAAAEAISRKIDLAYAGALEPSAAPASVKRVPENVYQDYMRRTLTLAGDGAEELAVAYSPLNGAGREPVRDALRATGARFKIVPQQEWPDGDFPTCPLPNPERDDAMASVVALARSGGADLALATDPDCDRLGVACRQRDGSYRRLTGNEVGLLLTDFVLARRPAGADSAVVKTIVTSDLTREVAARYGARVIDVLTGFKYIGEKVGELGDAFAFGFEESCGYLALPHVRDKDGVQAVLLVLALTSSLKRAGKTPDERLAELYAECGFEESGLLSVAVADARPAMERLRAHPPLALAGEPVLEARDYAAGRDSLPPADVLTLTTRRGKITLRPSGTEPKIKAYYAARGATLEDARRRLALLADEARQIAK